jgi:hypothetical protein
MRQVTSCVLLACLMSGPAESAQQATFNPDDARHLAGMWSDPSGYLSIACFAVCSDASLEKFFELLDDPANDATPLQDLGNLSRQQIFQP